ncbi:MAG TPA: hypothetical protein VGX52_08315 [Burkholderiales bacterium]|nr:hypothetical protein [Burkholderiales bacterium]
MKFELTFLNRDFPKKRTAVTVAALILVAGVVAGRERPAIELVRERAPQAAAAIDDDIDLDKLRRSETRLPDKDPFASMKAAEKQVAAVPQAPAKPSAPPLPFQYIGKWTQGEKTEVLLLREHELVSIEPGKKLGDYRVDEIGESRISFTYLPLKMKQTLDLPAVN